MFELELGVLLFGDGVMKLSLVFGELCGVMCFVQIDFFVFDFVGVMSDEIGFVQWLFQGFVVFDQSVGDVQVDCIGLVGDVVVGDGDFDVEFVGILGQFEWLVYDYV